MSKEERSIDPRFGLCIKKRRLEKEYSLSEMENLTGVSASYINRLEKGERKAPSLPIMQAIGKVLGVDIAVLLNLATPSETDEGINEIRDIVVENDFRMNDIFATTPIKELVIKLFDCIISAKWEENKFLEGAEMLQTIDKLEGLLGKA